VAKRTSLARSPSRVGSGVLEEALPDDAFTEATVKGESIVNIKAGSQYFGSHKIDYTLKKRGRSIFIKKESVWEYKRRQWLRARKMKW
jgi:hypothetical protein